MEQKQNISTDEELNAGYECEPDLLGEKHEGACCNHLVPDVLLNGLTQSERERVIAAHARMADCDATFHGSLALILCNAARVMAQVYEQNNEILGNAPFRIAEACEGVNIANAENTSTAYQSKVIITSLEATVSELSKEAEVSRKDRSSQHRWMITFGIVCVACSALTITETRICERAASGIQTDRFALLANAQLLLDAQKLVLARGKLNSDMTEVQRKWKQLQDEWKVQQTPELVELRKQLEAEYSTLKLRAQNILAKEEAEYGKL